MLTWPILGKMAWTSTAVKIEMWVQASKTVWECICYSWSYERGWRPTARLNSNQGVTEWVLKQGMCQFVKKCKGQLKLSSGRENRGNRASSQNQRSCVWHCCVFTHGHQNLCLVQAEHPPYLTLASSRHPARAVTAQVQQVGTHNWMCICDHVWCFLPSICIHRL